MILIDANVILRFLMGDNPEMLSVAKDTIESGVAFTIPSVLAEVVYVLNGYYEIERPVIRDTLKHLLDRVRVEHAEVIKSALDYYADRNVDFVDAILISRSRILGEQVLTFDKKLNKLIAE